MKTYIAVFTIAMLAAMLATPPVIRLARKKRIIDEPGARKVHASPIPRLGGLVILIAVTVATIPVLTLYNPIGQAFHAMQFQILVLQAAGLCVFLVGLLDDMRGLRARYKLLAQVLAAVALYASGTRIDSISITESAVIQLGWLSLPATILWVAAITNAVNLIDGLDGLAAGISAVTCGVIALIAVRASLPVAAVFMLAFLGSLIGFLVFNFNPARIFLGDSGSLFLGFVLAGCSILTGAKYATLAGLGLPLVALGVPLFDTLFSMLRRILDRRSLFAPDRQHIHHRLLERGFAHRQAVLILYGITITATGAGMLMMLTRDKATVLIFGAVTCFLVFAFRVIGAVRLRDSLDGLKRNLVIAGEIREERRQFEMMRLFVREATSFEAWWRVVCRAANEFGFSEVSLMRCSDGAAQQIRAWRCAEHRRHASGSLRLVLPLSHGLMPFPIRIEATLRPKSSFESAGRRMTLFSRLMDEMDSHQPLSTLGDAFGSSALHTASREEPPIQDPNRGRAGKRVKSSRAVRLRS